MKHIIILGDGMADHKVASLGEKTLLQYARPEYMNRLAREGRCGRLVTVPEGFPPGSEVANTAILGYDLNKVYEGRGPLEAASIGYEMQDDDFAIRCNIITIDDGKIITHNGGNLETDDARILIDYLNEHLGNDRVKFICGIQYRHLLVIKGGNKNIVCAPPHDHPNEEWLPLLVKPALADSVSPADTNRLTPQETADLINDLILKSQELLAKHSAVDLIQGIGKYAGLRIIKVPGATGLANTNYEGKAQAAIDALKTDDFVFVHVEATDEAGHDGDIELKLKAIDYLDKRLIKPILEAIEQMDEPVCIAVLPDHPTPVELRIHVNEPVPFIIWHRGIEADAVQQYDEVSCVSGSYGLLRLNEFINELMKIQ